MLIVTRLFAVSLVFLALHGTLSAQASPQSAEPNGTVTVKIEAPVQQAEKLGLIKTIEALSPLIAALAWPTVFMVLLLTQRDGLGRLLESTIDVVRSSSRIKLGDMIDVEVGRSAKEAEEKQVPIREASSEEVEAAARVSRMVSQPDIAVVRSRMLEFSHEYEATRSSMAPGPQRTRAMNSIVAKMRTIALASRPLLKEFAGSDSPGMRLAGTTILQLAPDLAYLDWLVERMSVEQPFVFFHASLALLAAVRSFGASSEKVLKAAIERALKTVEAFRSGKPDANTVDTLRAALEELG